MPRPSRGSRALKLHLTVWVGTLEGAEPFGAVKWPILVRKNTAQLTTRPPQRPNGKRNAIEVYRACARPWPLKPSKAERRPSASRNNTL